MSKEPSEKYLLDSDVLINYLRRDLNAYRLMKMIEEGRMMGHFSVIVETELYSGIRDAKEREAVEDVLALMKRITIHKRIAILAGEYRSKYFRSHSLETPDALIAASAKLNGLTLVTENKRHFEMIEGLKVVSTADIISGVK